MATGLAAPELSNGALFASAFLASLVVSGAFGAVMVSRCRRQGAHSTMATGLAAPELSNGAVFASAFLASLVVSAAIGAVMVSRCRRQGAHYERLLESEAQVA
eukprot:CAMPEP_0194549750 /NCGR_PEP_ID=MMETSP0253-20130528/95366_1 /TAXON_ID=2966 /ORGANISM="Noctiluca scintillans" /LENGTH=102 /DNA_ID=CAMNT_0039397183 /DNA_START=434 /DNA_END=742 /DNA_ORIENTATION=+